MQPTRYALSGSGKELWRNDLGTGDSKSPQLAAGPASVIVFGGSSAHVYDPTTGIVRYSTLAISFSEIVPDATGGLFLAGGGGYAIPGPSHVTVRRVDSSGIATWTASWTAEAIPAPGGSLRPPMPLQRRRTVGSSSPCTSRDGRSISATAHSRAPARATIRSGREALAAEIESLGATQDVIGDRQPARWLSGLGPRETAQPVCDLRAAAASINRARHLTAECPCECPVS